MRLNKRDCDICRGRGTIRLPVHARLAVNAMTTPIDDMLRVSHREYPCPECGEQVPQEQVGLLHTSVMVDPQIKADNPRYMDSVRATAARQLIDGILQRGWIEFEEGAPTGDGFRRWVPMLATIGVVSRQALTTIDERTAERQDQVARTVAIEAGRQIRNWGSEYGHTEISKDMAQRLIGDALRNVLDNWAQLRVAERAKER